MQVNLRGKANCQRVEELYRLYSTAGLATHTSTIIGPDPAVIMCKSGGSAAKRKPAAACESKVRPRSNQAATVRHHCAAAARARCHDMSSWSSSPMVRTSCTNGERPCTHDEHPRHRHAVVLLQQIFVHVELQRIMIPSTVVEVAERAFHALKIVRELRLQVFRPLPIDDEEGAVRGLCDEVD